MRIQIGNQGRAPDNRRLGEYEAFRRLVERRLGLSTLQFLSNELQNQAFQRSLVSAAQLLGGSVCQRDARGRRLLILAGYVDRMLPNALADRDGDTHLIAMYTPLFAALSEFAMFCFTQRAFFADVGDPLAETSPPPPEGHVPGLWLLRYTLAGGKVEERHREQFTPRDPVRYDISLYLGYLMARFVWFHEYAHCFNGHVAYVQENAIALRLYEVSEPSKGAPRAAQPAQPGPRDDELRCLELDADEAAMWATLQVQETDRENLESFASLDRSLRKRLTLFGAYAMTWLFEEFQNYMESNTGLDHPAPYLRLQNMVHLARQHFTAPEDQELQRVVLKEFDHIASVIPNMYRSDNLMRDISDPWLIGELQRQLARLDALRPALAPYRYAPVAGS
ncbi:hypothetical protein GN330_12150 [Nitratireductor sp. CAU 1489]|uniref:Uncharacterized protein n=1 Tax=Nitratireductor arenosus TaxID=2682096 RepID=A0A844QDC5_9HYPH|nr:hypothetical protein [Nitratireductor arenosus]MVA97996.1 hypothetical protein [Nitratireductor arenosus]